jgi:hypothetical protein
MKTNRSLWVILSAGLVICAMLLAYLPAQNATVGAKSKDWVGSWNLIITVVNQNATFPGLLSFFSDGNVIADETPSPLETSGHGNWVSTGKNAAAYTFVALIGNIEPNQWLKLTVSGTLTYDPEADQWNGPFTIVAVDQDGNEAFSDTGAMSGTRITALP